VCCETATWRPSDNCTVIPLKADLLLSSLKIRMKSRTWTDSKVYRMSSQMLPATQKVTVLWNVPPCGTSVVSMCKAAGSSKTLLTIYQTTRTSNPKDGIFAVTGSTHKMETDSSETPVNLYETTRLPIQKTIGLMFVAITVRTTSLTIRSTLHTTHAILSVLNAHLLKTLSLSSTMHPEQSTGCCGTGFSFRFDGDQ
jgi:hypothetical protein